MFNWHNTPNTDQDSSMPVADVQCILTHFQQLLIDSHALIDQLDTWMIRAHSREKNKTWDSDCRNRCQAHESVRDRMFQSEESRKREKEGKRKNSTALQNAQSLSDGTEMDGDLCTQERLSCWMEEKLKGMI